jgi:hypothetical protein
MKTKICSALLAFLSISIFAQSGWVGINTPDPKANLDVNGTIKVRQTPTAPNLTGYQILAVNQNTGGDFEVTQVDPQLIANLAVNTINGGVSTTVYSARKTAGVSLINLGILPNGFRPINFLAAERTVGTASVFSDTDNTYLVPTNGVYAIGFSFRYGTGVQAELLSSSPGIGILRNRTGVSTLIDSRVFSGANLGLVSLTVSESSINSLYTLQAGDRISFGLTGASVLNLGLLGSSTGSFYVYKVSN